MCIRDSYNGVTGHKTTVGLWPSDGVFPLSATFDSIGPICRTASDASLIHTVVTAEPQNPAVSLNGLRLAIPGPIFCDDIDPQVAESFNVAKDKLTSAGAHITDVDVPETAERNNLFPLIVGSEIITALTPQGFERAAPKMDPVTRTRASIGLDVQAHDYLVALKRVRELKNIVRKKFNDCDAWITPTCLMLPAPLTEIEQSPGLSERALLSSRNTMPVNIFELCATTLPMQQAAAALPSGLQLIMPGGQDSRLLATSEAIEQCLQSGAPRQTANISQFIAP